MKTRFLARKFRRGIDEFQVRDRQVYDEKTNRWNDLGPLLAALRQELYYGSISVTYQGNNQFLIHGGEAVTAPLSDELITIP